MWYWTECEEKFAKVDANTTALPQTPSWWEGAGYPPLQEPHSRWVLERSTEWIEARPNIFQVSAYAPRGRIYINFGKGRRLQDVITCAKFDTIASGISIL